MQWYKRKNFNSEKIARLSKTLNIPDVISSLLLQRGIVDFESAKHFFRPDWSQLHDPFLMKDMSNAVERIKLAINNNEIFEYNAKKNLNITDLTGAGDLFAAGYLHGIVNNMSTKESLEKGTELSSKVIQKVGARI